MLLDTGQPQELGANWLIESSIIMTFSSHTQQQKKCFIFHISRTLSMWQYRWLCVVLYKWGQSAFMWQAKTKLLKVSLVAAVVVVEKRDEAPQLTPGSGDGDSWAFDFLFFLGTLTSGLLFWSNMPFFITKTHWTKKTSTKRFWDRHFSVLYMFMAKDDLHLAKLMALK